MQTLADAYTATNATHAYTCVYYTRHVKHKFAVEHMTRHSLSSNIQWQMKVINYFINQFQTSTESYHFLSSNSLNVHCIHTVIFTVAHTHTHTHTHIHMHMHVHTEAHVHNKQYKANAHTTRTYMHTRTNTYNSLPLLIHTHMYVCVCMCARVSVRMYASLYTSVYMRVYKYLCARACICVCMYCIPSSLI